MFNKAGKWWITGPGGSQLDSILLQFQSNQPLASYSVMVLQLRSWTTQYHHPIAPSRSLVTNKIKLTSSNLIQSVSDSVTKISNFLEQG